VITPSTRAARIEASGGEGLGQLGEIAKLLLAATIIALVAALGSSIWQQRISLASLRVEGTRPAQLRRLLLIEALVMLSAGCITGALAGVYGQLIIDSYLKHAPGSSVQPRDSRTGPLEIFALVVLVVLALSAIPDSSPRAYLPRSPSGGVEQTDDRPPFRSSHDSRDRSTVFSDRRLLARAGLALVLANARYWTTVAPEVRAQLARWRTAAGKIEDPSYARSRCTRCRRRAFAAEVAATLAHAHPAPTRAAAIRGIVALEVTYDLPGRPHRRRAHARSLANAVSCSRPSQTARPQCSAR